MSASRWQGNAAFWNQLSRPVKTLTWVVGIPAWLTWGYWVTFGGGRGTPPAYAIIAFIAFAFVAVVQVVTAVRYSVRNRSHG